MIIFDETYCSEELSDLGRDVHEAFYPEFNQIIGAIPQDEYGFYKGTFKVTIQWIEE